MTDPIKIYDYDGRDIQFRDGMWFLEDVLSVFIRRKSRISKTFMSAINSEWLVEDLDENWWITSEMLPTLLAWLSAEGYVHAKTMNTHRVPFLDMVEAAERTEDFSQSEEEEPSQYSSSESSELVEPKRRRLPDYFQPEKRKKTTFYALSAMVQAYSFLAAGVPPEELAKMRRNVVSMTNEAFSQLPEINYQPLHLAEMSSDAVSVLGRLRELGHSLEILDEKYAKEVLLEIGQRAAHLYRQQYNEEPPKQMNASDQWSNRYPRARCEATLDVAIEETMQDVNAVDQNE